MRFNLHAMVLTIVVALAFGLSQAEAQKKGGTTPRFSVLELPLSGNPIALSEPNTANLITVAIDSTDAGYVSAGYAVVNRATRAIVAFGYLPEPLFIDPNDGVTKNGPSTPSDVNVHGAIVGNAMAFVPSSATSTNRAILWARGNNNAYSYVMLPELPGTIRSHALGLNDRGDIVGQVITSNKSIAVGWDADTLIVVNLNTAATMALGWDLYMAYDINENGLIVGRGTLNGADRGFLLNPATGAIVGIPLVGVATANAGLRIGADGRVVGAAWNGNGVHYGTNPDYVRGYYWAGPTSSPVVLPPVTTSTSLVGGMNDTGMVVGNSYIPTNDLTAIDTLATLWELDVLGNVKATDLQTTIDSKSSFKLIRGYDANNSGWISVSARKAARGTYTWPAALLVPSGN